MKKRPMFRYYFQSEKSEEITGISGVERSDFRTLGLWRKEEKILEERYEFLYT